MSVRSPESIEDYLEVSSRDLRLYYADNLEPVDLTGVDRIRFYPNGRFVELHCGRNIFFMSLQETPLLLRDPQPNPPCQN